MMQAGGCISWNSAQELMLYDSLRGHLCLNDVPVNSWCIIFATPRGKKDKINTIKNTLTRTEKIVPDGNCFICYVKARKMLQNIIIGLTKSARHTSLAYLLGLYFNERCSCQGGIKCSLFLFVTWIFSVLTVKSLGFQRCSEFHFFAAYVKRNYF